MAQKNIPNIYKQNQVLTATPKKLITLLYDESIKQLKLAEKNVGEKNYERASKSLMKTQDILAELSAALDFESGGEVSQNLYQLYRYLENQLVQANISKNPEEIKKNRKMIEELRETWVNI